MAYYYPFGEKVYPLVQRDRSPKKVFVLGVYASAVHAKWRAGNKTICQALAVASERAADFLGRESAGGRRDYRPNQHPQRTGRAGAGGRSSQRAVGKSP